MLASFRLIGFLGLVFDVLNLTFYERFKNLSIFHLSIDV